MNPATIATRATQFAVLTALALSTAMTIGLSPAAAAPAAVPLPRPDLIDAEVRLSNVVPAGKGAPASPAFYVDLTWIDKATGEDGYEIMARVPTTDGSINVTSKMIKGAIAGTENVGHGTFDALLKAGQRYCFSVRAYQLHTVGDTYGTKSNEMCLTMPAPATPAPPPAPAPATTTVDRSSVEYIKWVQGALNQVDGAKMPVDGDFGLVTDRAVRHFQTGQAITVDGIVGPVTEAALIKAGAPMPPGTTRTGTAKLK